jgi:ferritin
MLSIKVAASINRQIEVEHHSSQIYLAMASWAETNGYEESSKFLYAHAEEERMHMLKFFHYVNDRGSHALVPKTEQPKVIYDSIKEIFEEILEHEIYVSLSINHLVGVCVDERDFTTQNFLQWFVTEQIEEESLFRSILDKLNLLGDDKASLFMFEKEIASIATSKSVLKTV